MLKKISLAMMMLAAVAVLHGETVQNSSAVLEWKDGVMEFRTLGDTPASVRIKPVSTVDAKETFSATIDHLGNRNAIILHGKDSSLAFVLYNTLPAVRVSCPWNVRFTLDCNAEAVVLPDDFGEDTVLEPGKQSLRIPGFIPFFMALLHGENATLACTPVKPMGEVMLSGDLKQWSFAAPRAEEYILSFHTGKQIWHKITTRLSGEKRTEVEWTPGVKACYRAAMPLAGDAVEFDHPAHYVWNVGEESAEHKLINCPRRMVVMDPKLFNVWCSGGDGSFDYPAVLWNSGKLEMRYPKHKNSAIAYDSGKPVYCYTYSEGDYSEIIPELATHFMTNSVRTANTNVRTFSIGFGPATCELTNDVIEKMLYKSEGRSRKAEMLDALARTQQFVESIRSRIEQYRIWAKEMLEVCQDKPELACCCKALENFEVCYSQAYPVIQTPSDAFELQKTFLAQLNDENVDDDELEEAGKAFGRATRTLAGRQDNLVADLRHLTKMIRQQAIRIYLESKDEATRVACRKIYGSSTFLMQDYYNHEGK